MVNIKGFNRRNKSNIKYPNLKAAMRPVPHCDEIPVPIPLAEMQRSSECESERSVGDGEHYQEGINNNSPKLFSQTQLNNLTRKSFLSKGSEQLLMSR